MFRNELARCRLRHGKGITKAHLARKVGVSRSYITKLENGTLQPSGRVMFEIADYFGCRVEQIFRYVPGKRAQLQNR